MPSVRVLLPITLVAVFLAGCGGGSAQPSVAGSGPVVGGVDRPSAGGGSPQPAAPASIPVRAAWSHRRT
jgi:hypothetical protein